MEKKEQDSINQEVGVDKTIVFGQEGSIGGKIRKNNVREFIIFIIEKKGVYVTGLLIATIAFVVFKDFLLYKKAYLFQDIGSDTITGALPIFYHITDYFEKNGFVSWSFNMGMGQSLFPLLFRDFFDVIIYASGTKNIYYLVGLIEFIKIICAGILFYLYLQKLNLHVFSKITGAVLFSFCAFMIVGGGWFAFSAETVNLALFLLGFELLFQNNRGLLFALACFLFALSMPFNLYVYGVFIGIYSILRYFITSDKFKFKELFSLWGKMLLFAIIGVCLAGPFLLENISKLLESPRGSGGFSYFNQFINMPMFERIHKFELGTCVMRFFSSDIFGFGYEIDFRGWGNLVEAPMFYCGLPCLLLMPQVFFIADKKQKIAFASFIVIWCFPILFPYFRRAFWLFTGDYYRTYSFFVSLAFLIVSVIALDLIIKKRKINLIVLLITLWFLFYLIGYPYFVDKYSESPVVPEIATVVQIFLISYTVLIFALSKVKHIFPVATLFLFLICIEVFYMSDMTVNKRTHLEIAELSEKFGYNDYSIEAIKYIQSKDKTFYRVDKNYLSSPTFHPGLNDAMIQNYYGTCSYNGFSEISYINYLKNYDILGKNEFDTRWAVGLNNRVMLESINSVKYLLIKKYTNPLWHITHDSLTQFGNIKVLRNKYVLPLGFCYDSYIKQSDFEKLDDFQKDFISLNGIVINDDDENKLKKLKRLSLRDTLSQANFTWENCSKIIDRLKKDTLSIEKFSQTEIKGNITIETSKVIYFSIPYDKAWHIKINDIDTKPLLAANGMMALPLNKGNNVIELEFAHVYITKGIVLSLLSLLSLFYVNKKLKTAKILSK